MSTTEADLKLDELYRSITGRYKVLVKCITFNHSQFIVNSLNGFVSQKTDFDYICYVVDDASTDGEQDVIVRWMQDNCDMGCAVRNETVQTQVIIAKPVGNQRCTIVANLLKTNMHRDPAKQLYMKPLQDKAEYVAMCEGDDYWTNPSKLQMQYEYLEAHNDCSMCFHNAIIHYEDSDKEDAHFSYIENRDYTGPEIYKTWTIPTASVFLRRSILDSKLYDELSSNQNFAYGDIILFISCAEQGIIHGLSDVMSVYRRHTTSYSYVAPMLPRCRHHYEIFKTIGGEYKDIARRNVLALAIPQFFLNLQNPKVRAELFNMCWDVDKTQTLLRITSFPFHFINDKIHQ